MQKIDSHQHFWKFDPVRDSWINEKMEVIKRDFLPEDLIPALTANEVIGTVVVQSDVSEEENIFQLNNADNFDFIKGVVGWVDFENDNLEERLAFYSHFEKLKGFRHILQGELARDKMLQPKFLNGIGLLEKYNYTYDLLVLTDQLQYLPKLLAAFPNQKFVIDHLAKPNILNKEIGKWRDDMKKVASFDNVHCKISGMVTEGDVKNWKKDDFEPYLDTVVESFGIDRIMFGSDWPVCLLAASYNEVVEITTDYFAKGSNDAQNKFFAQNATAFYNL